jgi:hypothetical protein
MSSNPPTEETELSKKTSQRGYFRCPAREDHLGHIQARRLAAAGRYCHPDGRKHDPGPRGAGSARLAGLAERVPYRGVRVREMSTKDVVEAYGMRLFLEAVIAQEAARNITPEQIAGLERTIMR